MPFMVQTRINLAAAVIAAFATLAGPLPAFAAEEETPSELAREGMERMLRAIELMIEMIPQYEVPEVLENGDIIIRRKNPPPVSDEEEEVDETRT
jgi:hypothetical protein